MSHALTEKPKIMKKFLKYILIAAVASTYGQELNLPTWTQYLADNEFVISPTFAGIGDNLRVRVNGLTQWVGIKNAPDNQSFYIDARISNRSGVGISAYNDKNGNTLQKGAKFSFAHHIVLHYYTKQFLSVYRIISTPLKLISIIFNLHQRCLFWIRPLSMTGL